MLWSGFRLHGDLLSWDVIAMILTIQVIDYINVTHGPRSQYQSIIPGEKLRNNPLLKTLQPWGGATGLSCPRRRIGAIIGLSGRSFGSIFHFLPTLV